MQSLHTVIELESFLKRARAIMTDEERMGIVTFLAANPEAGVSLGGGLRKVRIAREGGGKSGGYRTLYVFGGATMPLFLVTVFAKNEKDNLTEAEQAAAVALSKLLLATYGAKL
ncbi:helix-turn-helix domain-containing protein [Asticcacaulis biprosthecium C19]|uniref:Helix-turn-helix domain-containing protein n=2 Tax=Asticcacaulis biprosthecium TaxID=76891 RepID=F4QNF9_9CAUL|nr:helix-turn-helix domain-containing protein [Asticcacaulis biprosthecium C19]